MATTFQQLLAAMAFDAYRPSRENYIDLVSSGWSVIDSGSSRRHQTDGFDATVFRSDSGQIVIAFRGTDADSLGGVLTDGDDDILIGKGSWSNQVANAVELVADVMADHPGADIQFTGHSLGGGLASLMAVFFGKPAYVFAPAPFALSANDRAVDFGFPIPVLVPHDTDLIQRYFAHYKNYQASKGRAVDPSFKQYADAYSSDLSLGQQLYEDRQLLVTGTFIKGEVLEGLRGVLPTAGQDNLKPILIGDTDEQRRDQCDWQCSRQFARC